MGLNRQLVGKYHRTGPRVHSLGSIFLNYEGHSEEVSARPPDVSTHGMFINTSRNFPEGAVLNLKFLLSLSGVEIQTRCEVRYCLKGVGVGVEFVGIEPEAVEQIEREIQLCAKPAAVNPRAARQKKGCGRRGNGAVMKLRGRGQED
ncbi:MAG: PilZ domain-containing protein [Candidatus Acidiferrales bacterium]